jgi:hypothetical protein
MYVVLANAITMGRRIPQGQRGALEAPEFLDRPTDPIYRVNMDGSRRLWPRADLRAGDADRQAVVDELQRHYIDGRLTSDELGERVAQTLNARTFGDLAPPLADLPILEPALPARAPTDLEPEPEHGYGFGVPLGAILVVVGLIALMAVFVFPGMRFGFMPFWPLMIWGFFIFGRPHRGRRF